MDGTFKEAIVATNIRQVNGLAIDYTCKLEIQPKQVVPIHSSYLGLFFSFFFFLVAKRLYWSDGVKDVIEYCDFDGKNRYVLLKDEQAHIANLVVAGNFVYYTAINRQ